MGRAVQDQGEYGPMDAAVAGGRAQALPTDPAQTDRREQASAKEPGIRSRPVQVDAASPGPRERIVLIEPTASAKPKSPESRHGMVFAVSMVGAASDELLGSYLDGPVSGEPIRHRSLNLRGWVVGRLARAVGAEVVSGGRIVGRAPVTGVRDDVAGVYPNVPGAAYSGFGLTVRLLTEEAHELTVQAVLKDQRRVPLARIRTGGRLVEAEEEGMPLVSVIIPCYNQAHYLHEAIESVLAQTYPHLEVVVIDDGSEDNTSVVAGRYPGVRCIRQSNGGLPAARNAGIRESTGSYLVFLDADDRLLPQAVEAGLACFAAHPDAAFVSGRFRIARLDGAIIAENEGHTVEGDAYLEMLKRCYIPMHATVMFRRAVFETVRGYDATLPACEDYDLYLRITREYPVACHDTPVADYRRHIGSMSGDSGLMLATSLKVLKRQSRYLNTKERRKAYREGIAGWKRLYGEGLAKEVRVDLRDRRWQSSLDGLAALARHYPRGLISAVGGGAGRQ